MIHDKHSQKNGTEERAIIMPKPTAKIIFTDETLKIFP